MHSVPLVLEEKRMLTHDTFELIFSPGAEIVSKPGHFFTFLLPSGLRRAYSIAYRRGADLVFLIKRLEEGKGGSKEICDLEVGSVLGSVGPLGHFTLRTADTPKLFIGTGTGFAPLYYQLTEFLASGASSDAGLIYGVRSEEDLLYLSELATLAQAHPNFSYSVYLSRQADTGFRRGYVTDFITAENLGAFREFYLCGSPNMVSDARAKLQSLGMPKENVFFEQY